MAGIRTPRTTAAATALLERVTEIDGAIALIEASRNDAIAAANSAADTEANPLLTERADIIAKLEPWWKAAMAELTGGKRKSIELGGCNIGTRSGRASLSVAGDEDAIVEKLKKREWAKPLLRIITKLDRKATLTATDGAHKKQLATLGLTRSVPAEIFFVERAEQAGTRAAA